MLGKVNVSGYTSLILSIWLLSGIIIFILGVTGLYVGKIFEEVKERPYFIIKEVVN
jgi:dolichol-phosphate mannosyltransferase